MNSICDDWKGFVFWVISEAIAFDMVFETEAVIGDDVVETSTWNNHWQYEEPNKKPIDYDDNSSIASVRKMEWTLEDMEFVWLGIVGADVVV